MRCTVGTPRQQGSFLRSQDNNPAIHFSRAQWRLSRLTHMLTTEQQNPSAYNETNQSSTSRGMHLDHMCMAAKRTDCMLRKSENKCARNCWTIQQCNTTSQSGNGSLILYHGALHEAQIGVRQQRKRPKGP